ncbi:MAG: aminotransferase class I/II-fold pyridoxal phosphate-dependent enzyme [Thiomargarita sp.]|nr:aminotransferase class I/II-fold pyridoxal phosphate-dependent enzyme [Thiomargarita sp.]
MKKNQFKDQIAQYIDYKQNNIFLYWKGRVALYAILKAMGIKPNDEIILPAYTCVVVPNAIIYLGANPVYVDICESTYNMDITKVEAAITDKTKVIICQNTYGLSSDLGALINIAKRYNLHTIEDCTHGFGGFYRGKPNGQFCDAAFFSTQWNKPFSTGIGGFAITKSAKIVANLAQLEPKKYLPSLKDGLSLKALYFVKRYIINDFSYWTLVKLYRLLSKYNLVIGSSSGGEISSTKMPNNFFKDFSSAQAKEGLRNLKNLTKLMQVRKQNAKIYSNLLQKLGKIYVNQNLFDNHGFLKYPILVKDRDSFLKLAEKNRIELGDWFISPLHPVIGDLTAWQFDKKSFPVATFIAQHIVNLPTTPTNINKVITFIETNINHIL